MNRKAGPFIRVRIAVPASRQRAMIKGDQVTMLRALCNEYIAVTGFEWRGMSRPIVALSELEASQQINMLTRYITRAREELRHE